MVTCHSMSWRRACKDHEKATVKLAPYLAPTSFLPRKCVYPLCSCIVKHWNLWCYTGIFYTQLSADFYGLKFDNSTFKAKAWRSTTLWIGFKCILAQCLSPTPARYICFHCRDRLNYHGYSTCIALATVERTARQWKYQVLPQFSPM